MKQTRICLKHAMLAGELEHCPVLFTKNVARKMLDTARMTEVHLRINLFLWQFSRGLSHFKC